MASSVINNLYPPIVNSWMPAFIYTEDCRVYFSLSDYNTISEINSFIQVIISYQDSNLSALDSTGFPTEVCLCQRFFSDDSSKGDYYITIPTNYIKQSNYDNTTTGFEIGKYYKVQIRFTSSTVNSWTYPSGANNYCPTAQWLTLNEEYFSEWSTVCLIRPIATHEIQIRNLTQETTVNYSGNLLIMTGKLVFDTEFQNIETDYLNNYSINLYNNSTNLLLVSSGEIITNEYNPNQINYTCKYALEVNTTYKIEFNYTTYCGYSNTIYYFIKTDSSTGTLVGTVTIEATPDNDNGRIFIKTYRNLIFSNGTLNIYRSSSKDNFMYWEIIYSTSDTANLSWYDYTAEPGVFYYYAVPHNYTTATFPVLLQTDEPVMIYPDDAFLTTSKMQLKLKFDPQITSYKKDISESKTDTIGSKYPYFTRNGNIGYREFAISGLIMSYCDQDQLFSSPDEYYGNSKEFYESFNTENLIPEYQDFIYERNFREQVMDFLYADDVKLFRSLTEGNILIKLMNVSFTPNQSLGRMLYSFSATAYEVDDCTVENYTIYNILGS